MDARTIIGYIIRHYARKQSGQSGNVRELMSRLRPRRSDMIFVGIAVALMVVFIIMAIIELVTATPIGKWIADLWHAIMGTSLQNVQQTAQQALNQSPNVQLPNATLGDLLSGVGKVLIAPLDAVIAFIIVLIALVMRVKLYVSRVVVISKEKRVRATSWLLLAASLLPSVVEVVLW